MAALDFSSGIRLGQAFRAGRDQDKLDAITKGKQDKLDAIAEGEQRQKELFEDTRNARIRLEANDITGTKNVINERLRRIQQRNGDVSDTLEIKQAVDAGDFSTALAKLDAIEGVGVGLGVLSDPLDRQIKEAQLAKATTASKPFKTQEQIEREIKVSEGSLSLRRQELQQRQTESGKIKLSPRAEKAIIDSQDAFFRSGSSARRMELLAEDIGRLEIGGGLASTVTESFKNILGSSDEVTALRKRFNAIRSSQATTSLPPGPASDKDIALALSGFPKENANAEQIKGFLRGQAKLARIDEKFNEFKSEFISNNNSVKGLISSWKSSLEDPAFLSDILNPQDRLKPVQGNQEFTSPSGITFTVGG